MKKESLQATPYLYFVAILLWIFTDNLIGGKTSGGFFILILFGILFIAQLFFKSKSLDIFLIAICLVFTSWMSLAYLSDVVDIKALTDKAWRFIILCGLFTIANIIMTGWLFFNLKNKESEQAINAKSW